MISSKSLNLLQPNVVWWYIIVSQIVFQKDWFAVFKVKVTVKAHVIKIWISNTDLFATKLGLIWWYIIKSWVVLWKGLFGLLWWRSRSKKRFAILVNMMHHQTKFGCQGNNSSDDTVERVIFLIIWAFTVTLTLKTAQFFFLHFTLAHDAASPYQVW